VQLRRFRVTVVLALAACAAWVAVALTDHDGTSRAARQRPAGLHHPVARRVRSVTIGYSAQRRPIRAVLVGDQQRRAVLVVGCIHGNEPAGIAVTRWLATRAHPRHAALWLIPDLNPDGVVARTRQNAHGVDLNRNFPYRWQPIGTRGDQQYSGERALSEPESRSARRFILKVRPAITIWFHQPEGLVDLSGGNAAVERRFARLVELPVLRLTRYPGSAVGWENWRMPGTTAFVVELPPGRLSPPAVRRYASAVLQLADGSAQTAR
jgi:murein peptide amidase A